MNILLFTIIKNKAVDYYRENFGPVYSVISDHEENTFSFRVDNHNHNTYEKLSEGVEPINYKLDLDFKRYGITLPIKQVKAIKYVTETNKPFNGLFKVTYTITEVKDDEPYFMNWKGKDAYDAIRMEDCGKKLAEFLENTFFFRCTKTYSSKVNPEVVERTYNLKAIRPTNLTAACGDQTLKFVGYVTDDGFDSPTQDPVNHPNHYEMVGPFESFDVIVESLGVEWARHFCQGNIIKYQTRYRNKNGEEDLKKRHWYSRMDQMLAKCKTIEDYYKLKESEF